MHLCPLDDLTPHDRGAVSLLPEHPSQTQIEAFGRLIESLEGKHGLVDIGTSHVHTESNTLYGRGVLIPAGSFLVGLPHKADHLNVCVGDVVVWTPAGRSRHRGAQILPAGPGVMRVGYAVEDTTWFSVHHNTTGGRDLAAIEDSLVEHPERLITRRVPLLEAA